MDDSFQPTIDMLLNVSIMIWFGRSIHFHYTGICLHLPIGAVCPWSEFVHNSVIPFHRLFFLGILVLLLRRPPIVYAMHKQISQIEEKRQALYVGFFGPIGVSAVFYLYVTLEFLRKLTVDGEIRPDAHYLMEVVNVVVWFLVVCSVVSVDTLVEMGSLMKPGHSWIEYTHGQVWILASQNTLQSCIFTKSRQPRGIPHRRRSRRCITAYC